MHKLSVPLPPGTTAPVADLDGYDDETGGLVNLCECRCCVEASPGREECYETSKLMFEVRKCTLCDAQRCARNFRHVCTTGTSLVKAVCIERKAWFMRLVPFAFIVTTIVLVVYALLTHKVDPVNSYWEIRETVPITLQHPRSLLKNVPPAQLQTPLDPIRSGCASPRSGARTPTVNLSEQASLLESAADVLRADFGNQTSQPGHRERNERPSPLSRSSTPPLLSLSTVPEIDEEEEEGV